MTDTDSTLLTIKRAALELGISRNTAHRLVDDGRLRFVRVGTDRRVPLAEVRRFASQVEVEGSRDETNEAASAGALREVRS